MVIIHYVLQQTEPLASQTEVQTLQTKADAQAMNTHTQKTHTALHYTIHKPDFTDSQYIMAIDIEIIPFCGLGDKRITLQWKEHIHSIQSKQQAYPPANVAENHCSVSYESTKYPGNAPCR